VILLELAAQGVRGVSPAGGRATLRPGYNVVGADGAALRRLVEALLYPRPGDGDELPRAAGGPASAALRAGLTVVGQDRITYRLVRDFAAGAQLHRFDPEKRSFALVSQALPEIAAFLQKTAGVPAPGRLAALLTISAAELPSKQGGGAAGGSLLGAPARAALSPEQSRKRLGQLKAELEKAKVAEKLQYQLDGLQAQAFKLEEALKGGNRLREAVEKARAARDELEPVARAAAQLGDPAARLAAYEKACAKRDEVAAKVAAERQGLDEREGQAPPPPLWRAPLFWAGVGGGAVLALAGALLAGVTPGGRYVALLDIPAFGWSAWVALRWIDAHEDRDRLVRRRRIVDDWDQKVQAQFEKDAADVRTALATLSLSKPAELKEALGRVAEADATLAEARRKLAEWEASPEARAASGARTKLEEQQAALEARMSAEVGGFVRDVRSVESEIQRLEGELAAPAPAPVAVAAPAAAPPAEPLRALLERAAAELGGSPSAAGRTAATRASQALSGLTFQRLSALQVDDRGGVQVVTGGRPTPAMTLPLADRDVVFLSLKLALLEQALATGRQVALVDDAFAALSDGGRRFAAKLLKQVARAGQVIHATVDPAFKEAADHSA
jgi:hypothetical protein